MVLLVAAGLHVAGAAVMCRWAGPLMSFSETPARPGEEAAPWVRPLVIALFGALWPVAFATILVVGLLAIRGHFRDKDGQ